MREVFEFGQGLEFHTLPTEMPRSPSGDKLLAAQVYAVYVLAPGLLLTLDCQLSIFLLPCAVVLWDNPTLASEATAFR